MRVSFEQFIKERVYLLNVPPKTVEWYQQTFRWLGTPTPTEEELKTLVLNMRERGLKPTSCNSRVRAVNAFLRWSGSAHRLPKQKEPVRILPTFTLPQIAKMMRWNPRE